MSTLNEHYFYFILSDPTQTQFQYYAIPRLCMFLSVSTVHFEAENTLPFYKSN